MRDDAMRPYLVRSPSAAQAAPVSERAPAEPIVRTIERVIEKAADAQKPAAWRFEVIRGEDNLVTEIIATPIGG